MLIMPVLWFSRVMLFYGISFSFDKLAGDPYINGLVAGSSDMVVYIAIGYLADCFGRKPLNVFFYTIGGVGAVIYCFVSKYQAAAYVMLILARSGGSSTF